MDYHQLCKGCMEDIGDELVCPNCGWVVGAEAESPLHLEPGTVLADKYLVGRALGQGGFGITYLAWDLYLDRKLAIKEYFPRDFAFREKGIGTVTLYSNATHSQYDYGLDKFLQEGKTLAQFEGHPNIVSVRDFFKSNGTAYLVMNYVDGISLAGYLKNCNSPLEFLDAARIIIPVLDALKAIHAVGLLHRDISPDNIYITSTGQVIILDFGAARQAMSEKGERISVILKPGYAPEEQYRSSGIQGPWTDIYAVGATLYQAVTGKMPPDSLDRLQADTLVLPSELGAIIAPHEQALLLKALAVKAENRFQSVEEFIEQLRGNRIPEQDLKPTNFPEVSVSTTITIGRASDNNIVLCDNTISRYHAALYEQAGFWYLEDLQSTAGTYLNGSKLVGAKQIAPGSLVGICDHSLYFDGTSITNGKGRVLWRAVSAGKTGGQSGRFDYKGLKIPAFALLALVFMGVLFFFINALLDQPDLNEPAIAADSSGTGEIEQTYGTIEYRDGTYTGPLKDGLPHGYGTIVFRRQSQSLDFSQIITPQGEDKYSGEWFEGEMHGEGMMTLSDGTVIKGVWLNDQYQGAQ